MSKKITSFLLTVIWALFLTIAPVQSQNLILPDLRDSGSWFFNQSEDVLVSSCIYLDGFCLFKITSPRSEISQRIEIIEQRLQQISQIYFQQPPNDLRIWQKKENGLPNIFIASGGQEIRLLTVTPLDSEKNGVDPEIQAQQIIEQLIYKLQTSHRQRDPEYIFRNGAISLGIIIFLSLIHYLLTCRLRKVKRSQKIIREMPKEQQPISAQLLGRQQLNFKEVQCRLLQLLQWGLWLGGILFIFGRFPITRTYQVLLISLLRIPLRIGIVAIAVYLLIRLSYALIAKFNTILMSNYLLELDQNPRLELRAKTLTVVVQGIVILVWISIGIIVALSIIGVKVAPILTGLGILGVGISLASQNLIRDAINGFLIIIEDQYAVGDVIEVDKYTGLVENINLRITQIRDSEGRLISIPNSEIKIVANLSNQWSRADVSIPVAYDADVDKALMLIEKTAEQMRQETPWQEMILEEPQVLGVEQFSDRALIIRVWIKTQPLRQWDISREFRRRLKIVFEKANIPIPLPQQQLHITRYETLRAAMNNPQIDD